MKVKIQTLNQLQVETDRWLAEVLGAERAKDVRERNYRFGEEAIELMHACGMSFPDLVRLAIYVFNKPTWTANPAEEAGDTLHGLVGLITALGEDIDSVVAKSVQKLIERTEATKAKAAKWTGGPLPGDVDKQHANDVGMSVVGDLTEQLLRANRDVLGWQEQCHELKREAEERATRHQKDIARIEERYRGHLGDIKNLEMRLDNALELNAAQKLRLEKYETQVERDIPVVTSERGHVGVITGDPARFVKFEATQDAYSAPADQEAVYAETMPHTTELLNKLRHMVQQSGDKILRLENEVDRLRMERDRESKAFKDFRINLKKLADL